MACFVDSNVSQGRVATFARNGGIAYNPFTVNLTGNLPVKKIVHRLRVALKMHDLKMTDKENCGSGKCKSGK